MTELHFVNVGYGCMVLVLLPDGSKIVYDCNITDDNEDKVLAYTKKILGAGVNIDIFINSHRDADHMRGIKKLHKKHPIKKIWDTGIPGTSTTCTEYKEYMDLRRQVSSKTIEARIFWDYGSAALRCMNASWNDYTAPNDQSIVLKVEDNDASALLSGDTSYKPWKEKILPYYADSKVSSDIFLAAHHGSITFFDDPSDDKHYYIEHIKKISPDMTLVSVGPNTHDLPNDTAIDLYKKYSSGSNKGNKLYTTEEKGNMKLTLKDDGGWNLKVNQ